MISVGSEDGVAEDDRFTVSRGGRYVVTIEITAVENTKSAGRALGSRRDIVVGDDVQRQ